MLNFNVRYQTITKADDIKLVSDAQSYPEAVFNFLSDDWKGKTKTAIFKRVGASQAYTVVLTNDKCTIPSEVLAGGAGQMTVSVFGGSLMTCNKLTVDIYGSGYTSGTKPTPPTPDVYSQLTTKIDNYQAKTEDEISKFEAKVDGQVTEIKDDLTKLATDTKTLIGKEEAGYYSNGNHTTTGANQNKRYDVSECTSVFVSITSSIYYNNYTFTDSDDTVLAYDRAVNNQHWERTLRVPTNAKYLSISGNQTTLNSANVVAVYSVAKDLKATIDSEKINIDLPVHKLEIGGWHHARNELSKAFTDMDFMMFDVSMLNSIHVTGKFVQYTDFYVLFDRNLNPYIHENFGNPTSYDVDIDIDTSEAYFIGFTIKRSEKSYFSVKANFLELANNVENNPWKGKKIVWFGTSIPAGGLYGLGNQFTYPMMIAKMLGATVYNEAVGSSAVHCKRPHRVSTSNPYGFSNNWPVVSRCLSNSLEEMEWAIEHFDDTSIFNWEAVSSLSDADKEFIRSCSWEQKLNRYLTPSTEPDLWVFDHGHNDEITDEQEAHYAEGGQYDLFTYRGAMNFLINKIKEYNPFAKIIIIGEYENQLRPLISKYQKIVADDWSIPIYEQWSKLGWSQKSVKTTGFWSNGIWTPAGGTEHTLTYLDLWLPDHVHPHSDKSGRSLDYIARYMARWLESID